MLEKIENISDPHEKSIEVRRHDIRVWTKILEKAESEGNATLAKIARENLAYYRANIAFLLQRGAVQ